MYVEVPQIEILESFLDWYYRNISDFTSEVVMVADRLNYYNFNREVIAYIYTIPNETYFIRESEYAVWSKWKY